MQKVAAGGAFGRLGDHFLAVVEVVFVVEGGGGGGGDDWAALLYH